MAKFNVTCVTVDGRNIHHAFDEVRSSVEWALSALGHEVTITENWFSETGETNIIFGAELMAEFVQIPRNSIVYQLEQPAHPRIKSIKRLLQGLRIWNFSAENVKTWAAEGYDVAHVPIGYTRNLERIVHQPPDIDACFLGVMSPRRREFLESLKAEYPDLKIFTAGHGCYGGVRDQILSRTKLALNVHHEGRDQFEIVRCSYMMANGIPILTEPSSDMADYENLNRWMSVVPIKVFPEYIHSFENHSYELREAFRKRDFVKVVEEALESQKEPPSMPTLSRPIQHKIAMRDTRERFMQEAKQIDPVRQRFERAKVEGDMRDFVEYLRENAKGACFEIGVRDGASTAAILLGLENNGGHLYSIDVKDCTNLFKHDKWSCGVGDSKVLLSAKNGGMFAYDLMLIDGDHSRDGFRADLENCWQWTKPGGKILCHDITPEKTCEEFGGDWPSIAVGEEYFAFCERMGCEHEELKGYSGMGVIYKPIKLHLSEIATYPEPEKILDLPKFVTAFDPSTKMKIRDIE